MMRAHGDHNAARPAVLAAVLSAAVAVSGCQSGSRPDSPPAAAGTSQTLAAPGSLGTVVSAGDRITSVPYREQPWTFGDYEGVILTTPNYRVYTTLTQHTVLDRLPLFMERGLAHYTSALGTLPDPPKRLETYLFQTRNQWEAKTRQMLPQQAGTFLTLGRGGFTTRATSVLYYIGRTDTLAIAAHEGWHQYAQQTFRRQLPLWLEEGIATYMEGFLSHPDGLPKFRSWANLERFHTLRDAVRVNRLIPMDVLVDRSPQSFLEVGKSKLLIYYAQVWALVHFLVEGEGGRYDQALQRVLLDAAAGRLKTSDGAGRGRRRASRLGPQVIEAYFDPDVRAFEQRYLQFVRAVVRTGGRDRIVQGRSPLAD